MLISNEKDLELLLMNNKIYCGEISQRIGVSKIENRAESQRAECSTHQRKGKGQER